MQKKAGKGTNEMAAKKENGEDSDSDEESEVDNFEDLRLSSGPSRKER